MPRASLGSVAVQKETFPGEGPSQHLTDTAAGGRLHLHVGRHPGHGSALGNHGLAALQITDHDRKRFSLNHISHMRPSFFEYFYIIILGDKEGIVNQTFGKKTGLREN